MPSDDAAVSFVIDYHMSVDDLREHDIAGRSAAWRSKPLWRLLIYPVILLALVAGPVFSTRAMNGCFLPAFTAPGQHPYVWVWRCDSIMTPNGLLWQNGWVFAAAGAALVLALIEPVRALARPPRWRYRRLMKRDGVPGLYRFEVAADGLTTARPDGAISYVPWPVFTAVRETRERFFLESRYDSVWVLPKRGLADQSSVQQLGEFLRAAVGREPPSA